MKVDIKIDPDCSETAVVIVAKAMTDEVAALARGLQEQAQGFAPGDELNFVVGFSEGNASIIPIDRIVRFYTAQKTVLAETHGYGARDQDKGGGERGFAVKLRLYELEERLPTKQFVRISHAEIANLKMVKDFDLSFAGSIQVRFINGTTTFVSRRYVAGIKRSLGL